MTRRRRPTKDHAMCFGGGSQPSAPTNPAPYSLEKSHTAVESEAKEELSMENEEEDPAESETNHANKATSSVTGGSGLTALQM